MREDVTELSDLRTSSVPLLEDISLMFFLCIHHQRPLDCVRYSSGSNFLSEISFRKLMGDQLKGVLSSCLIFLEDRQANSLWNVAKLLFVFCAVKALKVKRGF